MRKYSTVKVRNPSQDGYSIKLLVLQSFEIICDRRNPGDEYEITTGEFLSIEEIIDEDDKITFKIHQKYDLTEWATISTTFLGNVILKKQTAKGDSTVTLCVYCQSSSEHKVDVITVVNPNDSLLKINRNQIVHLVLFDKNETARWSIDNLSNLKCVRCETVYSDFKKIYDKDLIFCPEPRGGILLINARLKSLQNNSDHPVVNEHHFWCCIDHENFKENVIEHIDIKGEYSCRSISESLRVVIDSKSSKLNISPDYFKAIEAMAESWSERSLSHIRHTLFRPRLEEDLEIRNTSDWFYLEIPAPFKYFQSHDKDSCWHIRNPLGDGVFCCELKPRYVNGVQVQRFFVSDFDSETVGTLKGVVVFDSVGVLDTSITVRFWVLSTPPVDKPALFENVEFESVDMSDLTQGSEVTELREISPDKVFYERVSCLEEYFRY